MALRPIVIVGDGDDVLRRRARPVRRVSAEIRRLMDDMVETMRAAPGVGLSAPQVGLELRVIVLETPIDEEDPEAGTRVHALADPAIVWASDDRVEDQEACLSIPGLYGEVDRHVAIRVEGLDRAGRRVSLEATELEARVFQHEIDHLDGVLFIDRVTGLDKLYTFARDAEGHYVRVPYAAPLEARRVAPIV